MRPFWFFKVRGFEGERICDEQLSIKSGQSFLEYIKEVSKYVCLTRRDKNKLKELEGVNVKKLIKENIDLKQKVKELEEQVKCDAAPKLEIVSRYEKQPNGKYVSGKPLSYELKWNTSWYEIHTKNYSDSLLAHITEAVKLLVANVEFHPEFKKFKFDRKTRNDYAKNVY